MVQSASMEVSGKINFLDKFIPYEDQ